MPPLSVTREIVKLAQPIRTVEPSARIGADHLTHAHVSETMGGAVGWVSPCLASQRPPHREGAKMGDHGGQSGGKGWGGGDGIGVGNRLGPSQ